MGDIEGNGKNQSTRRGDVMNETFTFDRLIRRSIIQAENKRCANADTTIGKVRNVMVCMLKTFVDGRLGGDRSRDGSSKIGHVEAFPVLHMRSLRKSAMFSEGQRTEGHFRYPGASNAITIIVDLRSEHDLKVLLKDTPQNGAPYRDADTL